MPAKPTAKETKGKSVAKKKDQSKEIPSKSDDNALETGVYVYKNDDPLQMVCLYRCGVQMLTMPVY